MLQSGNITVRRFKAPELTPSDVEETLRKTLPRCAFKPIDDAKGEIEKFGWVDPENILVSDISVDAVRFTDYVALTARRDKKTPSPAILKARIAEVEKSRRQERQGRRLSKEERAGIKEEVRYKLLQETSPTTAIIDCVWKPETGLLFVGVAGKSSENAVCLFNETTTLHPDWISPCTLAAPDSMSLGDAHVTFDNYGAEFLTWVLTKCLGATGSFQLVENHGSDFADQPMQIDIDFVSNLTFREHSGSSRIVTIAGLDPTTAPEVEQFLKERRQLTKAKISMSLNNQRYEFAIDEVFDLRNLKIPVPKTGDAVEYLTLRMDDLSNLFRIIDRIFVELFLPIRNNEGAWEQEQKAWAELTWAEEEG